MHRESAQAQFSTWLNGRRLRRLAALTGAGISAESGVPTFRGSDGLWQQMSMAELFTPQALEHQPLLAWQLYDELRTRIAATEPNAGHRALAELGRRRSLTVITQNIDGLHQRAGSEGVLELHGTLWQLRCDACRYREANTQAPLPALPPTCPGCRGVLRPDIVFFTEALPQAALTGAILTAEQCDLMLVVGTSGVVYPAAGLPHAARSRGALLVEVNPEETALTGSMDYYIRATAAEALPWVAEALAEIRA
ncbi:MAG: SIR2 family NAD-dependent protein deacylase [Armatimonadota bacterium]